MWFNDVCRSFPASVWRYPRQIPFPVEQSSRVLGGLRDFIVMLFSASRKECSRRAPLKGKCRKETSGIFPDSRWQRLSLVVQPFSHELGYPDFMQIGAADRIEIALSLLVRRDETLRFDGSAWREESNSSSTRQIRKILR